MDAPTAAPRLRPSGDGYEFRPTPPDAPSGLRFAASAVYVVAVLVVIAVIAAQGTWDWRAIAAVATLGVAVLLTAVVWVLGRKERAQRLAAAGEPLAIPAGIVDGAARLAADGKQVQAVRIVREATGLSLADAVALVDDARGAARRT